MENEQISPWFEKAVLGKRCCNDPPERCPACEPSGNCDSCKTVDGRFIEAVNEYASTCDRCGELTHHDHLTMDPVTQLGYCERCLPKLPVEIWERLERKPEWHRSKRERDRSFLVT